ncbi:MAG TPA: Glu/Leu/Phe/Val dehydrogenase dimerization domain-containing protein [Polyangia bacterium]|jgi:glutamate dehydrogenase/leucine dehydrogenase
MTDLLALTPQAFADLLRQHGIQRFYLVWSAAEQRLLASHPALEPLARAVQSDARDFDAHEGVFVQVAPETGVLQGAFVHRTCRGQAAGGVRFWSYDTVRDYLRDGLRLGRGMGHKNALAGLWWGGGKGVMARATGRAEDPAVRRRIYEEYGDFLTSLRGCYVTAEDVGTCVDDMAAIYSRTRFTTCIPQRLGGSGNPSVPTALGVVRAMEAALQHLGLGGLAGKTIAMQGTGNVGEPMIELLRERGVARITATDIDAGRLDRLPSRFAGFDLRLRRVERGDVSILAEEADILAPNATGAMLGPATIPALRARIVCGAANNQLEDPQRDDLALQERGVLYMPDFLVNRMGIVNCADEQYGFVDQDPAFHRHLGTEWDNSIYNLSLAILQESARTGRTPHRIACETADERARQPHPVWGHRGVTIIDSLVRGGWAG